MSDLVDTWSTAVDEVGRFVALAYPDVDKEDLKQDLWVWICEQDRFHSPEDDGCRTAMYWLARKKAAKYRAEHLTLSAQYCYRTDDVREIFDGWPNVLTSDTTDRSFSEAVVVHSDVMWAFSQLPDSYKEAIISRYGAGEVPPSGSKERKTLNRAIQKVADVLNTYSRSGVAAGPTVRKVFTNSQSRHRINENYSPEG